MSPNPSVVTAIRQALAERADPDRASGQKSYMKSAIDFYGVPVPEVRRLTYGIAKDLDCAGIVRDSRTLWDEAVRREERYAALALTDLKPARGKLELLDLHKYFALSGAWWDFVDWIAHHIADLLDTHPVQVSPVVRSWSRHDSFWLRRLSIVCQLGRRDRTDEDLLTEVIEGNIDDHEFFIRKAIGWALRDYARSSPEWVRSFVASHALSPLSAREATKHL